MNTAVKAGNTLYLSKGKQYIHPCLGVSIVVGCSPGHFGSVCNLKVIQLLKIVFKKNKEKQRVPYRNHGYNNNNNNECHITIYFPPPLPKFMLPKDCELKERITVELCMRHLIKPSPPPQKETHARK
jgi:hypothetical protein